MHFQLPTELQNQLLAYDPALKRLIKAQKSEQSEQSKRKPNPYPIGNVNDLIPADIVSADEMQQAVDHINSVLAPEKYYTFHRLPKNHRKNGPILPGEEIDFKPTVKAILYYAKSTWIALWLPPVEDTSYIFGCAYAITEKNAHRFKTIYKASRNDKHIPSIDISDMTIKQYGRKDFYRYSEIVTVDTVSTYSLNLLNPQDVGAYTKLGQQIKEHVINPFLYALRATVPMWEDVSNTFARISKDENNYYDNLNYSSSIYLNSDLTKLLFNEYPVSTSKRIEWVPTTADITTILKYGCSSAHQLIDKPFFQAVIKSALNNLIKISNDPENTRRRNIAKPIDELIQYCRGIAWIACIWDKDVPIDYYQTYSKVLTNINFAGWRMGLDSNTIQWLEKNMPIASMFNLLQKYYDKELIRVDNSIALFDRSFSELSDTIQMINTILKREVELTPPNRWRIDEFHDHVQAEAWKITNPLVDLPQDLFPEPIKVQHQNAKWVFFQPKDTHQLSQWGQAARNCVGASGYADEVKKRKSFIVLCMLDSKPHFTIQLTLEHGVLNVKQIKGTSNRVLTALEEVTYSDAFKQALEVRSTIK
jgi:hypothetical protein